MIHEVRGEFVISSREQWLPGAYETRQAARWAFQFPNDVLQRLQDVANERAGGTGGVITTDDLRAAQGRRR